MNRRIIQNLVIVLYLVLIMSSLGYAQIYPDGANITSGTSETKTPAAAEYINTSGGTFTTLLLYAETQNQRWKAYAGNVTGILTLDDAQNNTIYDWTLTVPTGEVYASRYSNITWADIQCADTADMQTEQTRINHSATALDNIENTFQFQKHKEFYVGNTKITNSTCPSVALWVNDTQQTASEDALFQEMVLTDTNYIIYSTIIRDGYTGFNFKSYDFQMIVPDRGVNGYTPERYYFWMELI